MFRRYKVLVCSTGAQDTRRVLSDIVVSTIVGLEIGPRLIPYQHRRESPSHAHKDIVLDEPARIK